jgi:hypothetical protein
MSKMTPRPRSVKSARPFAEGLELEPLPPAPARKPRFEPSAEDRRSAAQMFGATTTDYDVANLPPLSGGSPEAFTPAGPITAADMLRFDVEDGLLDAPGLVALVELLGDDEALGLAEGGDVACDPSQWPAWTDNFHMTLEPAPIRGGSPAADPGTLAGDPLYHRALDQLAVLSAAVDRLSRGLDASDRSDLNGGFGHNACE